MAGLVYRVGMPEPHTHLFSIGIRIPAGDDTIALVMPSWTPGSYRMREFARHVQEFSAATPDGDPLPWRKTDKNTWCITAGGRPVAACYRVYANELTVRTSHLDSSHATINGASLFMHLSGATQQPVTLDVDAPEKWQITTGLRRVTGVSNRFHAASYDELADCPLEIGTHELIEWEIDGVPHAYAIWGRGSYDAGRLTRDTTRIIRACTELFGVLPYDQFTFIVQLTPGGSGGLEHRNSTLLQADNHAFNGPSYERFLGLVAHEFFHVWNAKRIFPQALERFDYAAETYTRDLWVVEGLTTYYTDLTLRRAGLISRTHYLNRLGEAIHKLQALPGRHVQSLADASFDTWIKFYHPDEHTPNAQVSYYQKGAVVGLLLDMRIRATTQNSRSLDDLMRLLWERFGRTGRGYPKEGEGSVRDLAEQVAGEDLGPFFDAYVAGTDELDFDPLLTLAGLEFRAPDREAQDTSPEKERAGLSGLEAAPSQMTAKAEEAHDAERCLGARVADSHGRTVVTHVLSGSPAYRAGVNARDEFVALNGARVTAAGLPKRLSEVAAGETVEMALFRRDELLRIEVTPERVPPPEKLRMVSGPTAEQRALLADWLRTAAAPVDAGAAGG